MLLGITGRPAHPSAPPLAGVLLAEADMPDTPLLLVDGHNLLFRACFGFPARIRSRDKARDLTGVFGFFALLSVAVRDEVPAHPEMIVVFDGELGSGARRGTDPAYKAHRPGGEAALAPIKALPDVKSGLDALKISWIEIEDAEDADVIATSVSRVPAGPHVLIMSGDRDMHQLVTNRVLVLNTAMRPGQRLIGPKHIEARYGVPPIACAAGPAWPETLPTGSRASPGSARSPPPACSTAACAWKTSPPPAGPGSASSTTWPLPSGAGTSRACAPTPRRARSRRPAVPFAARARRRRHAAGPVVTTAHRAPGCSAPAGSRQPWSAVWRPDFMTAACSA